MADEKVSSLLDRWKDAEREQALESDRRRRGGDNGGSGGEPPMSEIERRVGLLEEDVRAMREVLTEIKTKQDTFASKADLANAETRIIKWNVGTIIAVAALVFAIIRLVPSA